GDGYSLTGNTGTDAGDYVAIATLDDPVNTTWPDGTTEPKTINWSISPKNLTNQMFSPIEFTIYTGNPISPTVLVKDGNITLRSDKDYIISYMDNTNAGVAKAIITGIGNYTGTIEKSFNISPLDVEVPTPCIGLTYNGTEQMGIPDGERYTLIGDKIGINAGSYIVSVSLIDPINTLWDDGTMEEKTINWSINAKKLTKTMVSQIENYEFSGNEATPIIEVCVNEEILIPNADYSFSYTDNINSGIAKVIITGIGNYSGTIEKTFNIFSKEILLSTINKELIYNGFEQIGVENGEGYTLTGDLSGLNAGTYSATVTLDDPANTVWSDGTTEPKTLSWTIAKAKLTAKYSGESIVFGTLPSLVVAVEGFVPGEGPGTSLGYSAPLLLSNETNAGTYTLVPEGGLSYNYEFEYIGGTLLISKKVIQIPVANTGLVYNGTEQIGVPESDGYMLSGSIGTIAGSYRALAALTDESITSWPDGGEGREEIIWSIAPKRIDDGMIYAPDQEYTGYAIEPVSVTDGNKQLVEGRDYVISYADNVRAGSAAAAVTGTGNYTGTVPVAFDILMRYLVSFDLNGFEGTVPGPQSVLGGTMLDLENVTAPLRPGYRFCGWSTTPWGSAVSEYSAFYDATLYAAWALNVYDSMPHGEIYDIISQNEEPAVQIRGASAGGALDNLFFERLADTGKTFTLSVLGENDIAAYSWLFDGEYRQGAGTFVPAIRESVPDFDLERLIDSSNCENPLVLNFSARGVLPICATVTYSLDGAYEDGTRLSVFYYDEGAGMLGERQTATVTDGAVSFTVSHCSRYVIAEETPSGIHGGVIGPYVVAAIVAIAFVDIFAVYVFFVRRR
ncbi:MAG: MBG domain-containing protein, partial [Candidatus Methanomethylophilaceae archaeon]